MSLVYTCLVCCVVWLGISVFELGGVVCMGCVLLSLVIVLKLPDSL